MALTFVVVPQWQGSGSSRAMQLVDGAEAIRGDLPSSATRVVEVPLEAGDGEGSGIERWSSVRVVHERLTDQLARLDGPALTVGGDCGVEWAAVEHVIDRDIALVWFDAHPDLNSPAESTSGAFHGMVLRTLIERGLPAERVVLAGTRSFDDAESAYVAASGIRHVPVPDLATPDALLAAVEATGAREVYVHVDLDVLDPEEIAGLSHPEPFGLDGSSLSTLIAALRDRFPLAGAGLMEFAPASPGAANDDLPVILRVIGALTAPRPAP